MSDCISFLSESEVAQSCLTLPNPMDYGLPDSSTDEIFWSGLPFPRRSSDPGIEPRSLALQADFLPSEPPGNPIYPF